MAGEHVTGTSTDGLVRETDSWGAKGDHRRIWWNSYQARWDAIVCEDQSNEWHIYTDVTGTPAQHADIDGRGSAKPTIEWDDPGKTLHVVFGHISDSQYYNVSYDSGTDTYSVPAGVSTGTNYHDTGNNANDLGGDHAESLLLASDGSLWVAVIQSNTLQVTRSEDGGSSWEAVEDLATGLTATAGQTTLVELDNAGTPEVHLLAVENDGGGKHFFTIDRDAATIDSSNWTDNSSNIPAYGSSDDHLSSAVYNNVAYFATKNEETVSGEPFIIILERTAGGVWTEYTGYNVPSSGDDPSRPAISIDTENEELHLFVERVSNQERCHRKKAPLSSLGDLASASETVLFESTGDTFTDVSAPRTVDSDSGVAVLVEQIADKQIWENAYTISGAQTISLPPVSATVDAPAPTAGASVALSPPVALGGGVSPAPTLAASVGLSPPVAAGIGGAPTPATVTVVSLSPPVAGSPAVGSAPTVAPSVGLNASPGLALADALAAAVDTAVMLSPSVAGSLANAIAPTVSTASDQSLSLPSALAQAFGLAPTVDASVSLSPPVAPGSGVAPAPVPMGTVVLSVPIGALESTVLPPSVSAGVAAPSAGPAGTLAEATVPSVSSSVSLSALLARGDASSLTPGLVATATITLSGAPVTPDVPSVMASPGAATVALPAVLIDATAPTVSITVGALFINTVTGEVFIARTVAGDVGIAQVSSGDGKIARVVSGDVEI